MPEHVVADSLASAELVALEVPEFAVAAMELFAMRRRDRAHWVVASALWEELKRSGASAAAIATPQRADEGVRRVEVKPAKRSTARRRPSEERSKRR